MVYTKIFQRCEGKEAKHKGKHKVGHISCLILCSTELKSLLLLFIVVKVASQHTII